MAAAQPSPTILWFRLDLRLADQPALGAALARGGAVIPVFLWEPSEEAPWEPGAASRWWLHHSLERLEARLRECGSRLVIRRGRALETLRALVRETGAGAVVWNRRYEPAVIGRDQRVKEGLRAEGVEAESFSGTLLREPWEVKNQAGRPFQVFTPYWRTCLGAAEPAEPVAAPSRIPAPARWPASEALSALGLPPRVPWDAGLRDAWMPGEEGAQRQLSRFAAGPFVRYGEARDFPGEPGTSRLSPHLHFGEIGPRQVWHAVRRAAEQAGWAPDAWRRSRFLAEIGWREFAHHLLFHFPHTPERPLRAEFERFPWRTDPELLAAWQRGRTGYPLVDAGMRELWATGWMHNRVRMIVASFLVKHLLISWQEGARWFWDTLVDADLAANTLGWQWTAGCGADAAPYFRVFNPVIQARKFDPDGRYLGRWVPELARLSPDDRHEPWEVSPLALRASGFTLDRDYPSPVVGHAEARIAALAALERMRGPRAA